MKRHNPERLLKSLIRERQRLWQMFFDNAGNIRITVEAGNLRTILREDVLYPHSLIEAYMKVLTQRINALASEVYGITFKPPH